MGSEAVNITVTIIIQAEDVIDEPEPDQQIKSAPKIVDEVICLFLLFIYFILLV